MSAIYVFQRPLSRLLHRSRVWWAVTGINMTAMSSYLWHVPAIMFAFVLLHAIGLDPPTEIGEAGYPVPIAAGPYFAWFALALVVFVVLLAAFVSLLWSTEYRPLPWWDSPVRLSVLVPVRCRGTSSLRWVIVLWLAFMILAIVGLRASARSPATGPGFRSMLWGVVGVCRFGHCSTGVTTSPDGVRYPKVITASTI